MDLSHFSIEFDFAGYIHDKTIWFYKFEKSRIDWPLSRTGQLNSTILVVMAGMRETKFNTGTNLPWIQRFYGQITRLPELPPPSRGLLLLKSIFYRNAPTDPLFRTKIDQSRIFDRESFWMNKWILNSSSMSFYFPDVILKPQLFGHMTRSNLSNSLSFFFTLYILSFPDYSLLTNNLSIMRPMFCWEQTLSPALWTKNRHLSLLALKFPLYLGSVRILGHYSPHPIVLCLDIVQNLRCIAKNKRVRRQG